MKLERSYPLRWLLLAPALVVLLGVVVGVGGLSYRAARVNSLSLEGRLVDEIANGIEQHLQALLRSAHDVVAFNAAAFRQGQLSADRPAALQQHLLNQIRHQPHLTFVSVGLPDGGLISASRHPVDGGLRLVTAHQGGPLKRYWVSPEDDLPRALEDEGAPYDSRGLAWYQRAAQSRAVGWYPVVAYRSYASLGLGVSAPLEFGPRKQLLGVAGADLGLVQLSRFLSQRFSGRPGLAFVAELDGKLLATSTDLRSDRSSQLAQANQARHIAQSEDTRLRAVGQWMSAHGQETAAGQGAVMLRVGERRYALSLRKVEGAGGLHLVQGVLLEEQELLASWQTQARWAFIWVMAVACIGTLLMLALLERLIRALADLGRATDQFAAGARAVRAPEAGPIRELRQLAGTFNHMRDEMAQTLGSLEAQVAARTEELARANAELQRQVGLDGLTQIANRRHFDAALDLAWRRCQRPSQPLALLLIDVDDFKAYNDHYGHQAGDECLKRVAQVLGVTAQRSGELAARYGGEEFVVILPGLGRDDALAAAERIRRAVQELQIVHAFGTPAGVLTISIGVATCIPTQSESPAGLLRAADAALYEAKHLGRNRVCQAA